MARGMSSAAADAAACSATGALESVEDVETLSDSEDEEADTTEGQYLAGKDIQVRCHAPSAKAS